MPNATVYIRKENEARWNDIPNKSDWINEQLGKLNRNAIYDMKTRTTITLPPTKYGKVCEHGAARGFCRKSKCKHSMFKK